MKISLAAISHLSCLHPHSHSPTIPGRRCEGVPQKPDNPQEENAGISRMSLDKRFHGDLEGSSNGEMLSFTTEVKGSAGYVAMERISGELNGPAGRLPCSTTPP